MRNFFTKTLSVTHLPTWFLIIGYPVYWLELYFLQPSTGYTTSLAWILFLLVVILIFLKERKNISAEFQQWQLWYGEQPVLTKSAVSIILALSAIILFVTCYASFLPPHLPQEYDALSYHITIPRQHLLRNSFQHLPWSTADFYLLPLDHGLAPFWLSTSYLNKIPQYFFCLGILFLVCRLVSRLTDHSWKSMVFVWAAVLGLHGLSIQFGTAMLDVVMLYFLLAALDSWLSGFYVLAGLELSFYVWSKSFLPIQILAIALCVMAVLWLFKQSMAWKKQKTFLLSFLIFSAVVAGPFLIRNFYYTGTPLFPFGVGKFHEGVYQSTNPVLWSSIVQRASDILTIKDQYGHGRSVKAFFEHFWMLAVPEKGVNNRFDYPLGLSYLLVLGPFMFKFFEDIKLKRFNGLSWFSLIFWASWWFGSQQSRFLFVPLVLMMIVVFSDQRFLRPIMLGGLLFSLALTALSVVRANKADFFKPPMLVLRFADKTLLEMAKTVDRSKPTNVFIEDAAFADFPINVIVDNSDFVLKQK
ncbi:MAG: hypothetical protein HQL26_03450 [Candidatus Omnitrophica bacterium]|nr:hypothetical protein [Candidatus Omnitrophota bacterium]